MSSESLDDQLDRLVAEFSDRLYAGEDPGAEEFLARVPEPHRAALARCLTMIRSGMGSAPPRTHALGPGVIVDGYQIVREIGRGGMAIVYLAEQQDLQRMVALKILRPSLAAHARHLERFRREALAVARLRHSHIVQIHAVGESDGHHYLAMEFIEGKSLAQILADLPTDRDWTADDLARATGIHSLADSNISFESAMAKLLVPVARAIAETHDLGMVHRDIKPSNILVHRDGRALIADFGLAKGDEDPALSLAGEPLGTPHYMSPEQAAMPSQQIDARSDIYSLGVTLFECLSGSRPYRGESTFEVLEAIRQGFPERLRSLASHCTPSAEAVVMRAMAHHKEDRYATANDLASDLSALAEGRQSRALTERGGWWRRSLSMLRRLSRGHDGEWIPSRHWLGLQTRAQAKSGGWWRRSLYNLTQITRMPQFEYISTLRWLGLPLVHINLGPRSIGPDGRRPRVAKGWLAVSDIAIGGLAIGRVSAGLVSLGLIGVGGLSAGLGIAMGGYSFGCLAAGCFATGALAAGYGAAGALSVGYYAVGVRASGSHTLDTLSPVGTLAESTVVEFMDAWMPWVVWMLPNLPS